MLLIINLSLQSVVKRSIRQSKIEDEDIFFYFLKPFRASYKKKNITDRKKEGRNPKKRKDKGRKKERERTLKKASTR